MASADILSKTLASITAIKLDELSNQRSTFEASKAELLKAVSEVPDQREKLDVLMSGIEELPAMGKLSNNPVISLENINKFLEQARCDPSVSAKLLKDWEQKLEKELDIHSLKYDYASLYGRLVNEWLSVSDDSADAASNVGTNFEKIGRKEMHDQRAKWEEYVFKALETDSVAIQSYLHKLFTSTKSIKLAFTILTYMTEQFEEQLAKEVHFDEKSLKGVIEGLLRSDLVSDEKRVSLKDFINNKVVLAEISDVLNMRMKTLDKWRWDPQGTPTEQRRHLNGRYRFYHDEDLLQSILLRYIGVRWSVFFKNALSTFQSSENVWNSSSTPVPATDRYRRDYFLGTTLNNYQSVETQRGSHFVREILLEQLTEKIDEKRGGYDDDSENELDTRKSGQQITQTLLHTLGAEIIMKTRLGEDINVVRTDFAWFGPSLPHSTMFAVLEFLGVSQRWVSFFRRALEAPLKFIEDGSGAFVQNRKRGTPISGPLSDMLGETTLFCLDFAFNQRTNGALMYRLHDDIWFWGDEKTCVKGWAAMTEFAQLMGLDFNEEKTGSVKITKKPGEKPAQPPPSLPKGHVRWGFLKLDSRTGRFLIDQDAVDNHIEELRRQLGACKSVFDWIQAWNVYGARFFINNFGKPANCFGIAHVDSMLDTFARIQSKLFASTGGSVTSTLKLMISERFGVEDIPEGYLYFPMSMGGLDLRSPFVNLYLVRERISKNPDYHMDQFFVNEEAAYQSLKNTFEKGVVLGQASMPYTVTSNLVGQPFMSMEEYTRYREQTSTHLHVAYMTLVDEPSEVEVYKTSDVGALIDVRAWSRLPSYQRWIIQLYAPDMIARFGGLNVVDKGLLPTGMVSMFRESRFKWQG